LGTKNGSRGRISSNFTVSGKKPNLKGMGGEVSGEDLGGGTGEKPNYGGRATR